MTVARVAYALLSLFCAAEADEFAASTATCSSPDCIADDSDDLKLLQKTVDVNSQQAKPSHMNVEDASHIKDTSSHREPDMIEQMKAGDGGDNGDIVAASRKQGLLEDTDKGEEAEDDKLGRYVPHPKYFTHEHLIGSALGTCDWRTWVGTAQMPVVTHYTGTFNGADGITLSSGRRRTAQCMQPSWEARVWPLPPYIQWVPGLLSNAVQGSGQPGACECLRQFIERCQPDADGTTANPHRRRQSGQALDRGCLHVQLCACPHLCGEFKASFGCPEPIDYDFLQQPMENKQDVALAEPMMMNASDTMEQGQQGGDGLMKRSTRMPDKEASVSLDETMEDKCQA